MAPFPANQIGMVIDPPNFISPELYPQRESEMERLFRELGDRAQLIHFKDLKLNASGKSVDLPGPGGGEMDYTRFVAEVRKLKRPLDCIIEHIKPEQDVMSKTMAWVDAQLQRR